jgi:hypothetical protein
MKKIKNTSANKILVITVVIVLLILIVGPVRNYLINVYWYYNNNGETGKETGQGPSAEELVRLAEYDKKCPLDALTFKYKGEDFNIWNVKCSYNADPDFQAKKPGEDGTVEIYTKDFEQGKLEFRDWLKSYNLEESSKLRIIYEHKPHIVAP